MPGVEAMMTKDEASRGLGIELIDQGEGRAVTRMTIRADMVNGHAMAHGGLIFALADTAFACACNSYGPVTVAASADIVFVAPARAGDVLVAEAVMRTRFGRSGLYDVTVRRDGEVIAEFRGRSHQLATTSVSAAPAIPAATSLASVIPPSAQNLPQAPRTARRDPPRRGRPGYDLASVLAVAVEIFNERGYDRTSMRDLAERLGIAKSAIYHHVTGKEELLRLALDRALAGLAAVTDRARALPAPAIERLEYLVRGSVEVLEAESSYVTLLLRVRGNTDVERAALDQRRAFDRFVAELVAEGRSATATSGPDADAMITARLLFGLVNSIVEWYRPARARARPAGRPGVRDGL